ncbi:MAG: hypothetical protein ACOC2M_02240, partial [bacterium]
DKPMLVVLGFLRKKNINKSVNSLNEKNLNIFAEIFIVSDLLKTSSNHRNKNYSVNLIDKTKMLKILLRQHLHERL